MGKQLICFACRTKYDKDLMVREEVKRIKNGEEIVIYKYFHKECYKNKRINE